MVSACRESPLTKADARFYKDESFRVTKNVSQTQSSYSLFAHAAEAPISPYKQHQQAHRSNARQNQSSIAMFNVKDSDTFTSPSKKTNTAMLQTMTSDQIYASSPAPRQQVKKASAIKTAEITGSGTVKYMPLSETKKQNLQFGNCQK
jgi:hypothetical protein